MNGGGLSGESAEAGPGDPGIGDRIIGASEPRTLDEGGPKKKCLGLAVRLGVVGSVGLVRSIAGNGPEVEGGERDWRGDNSTPPGPSCDSRLSW